MAFCLKIQKICQRSVCASTLDPQASLLPVLSIITINHLKSGCHDVKKRGDFYLSHIRLLSLVMSPNPFFGIRIHTKLLAKMTESLAIPDPKLKKKDLVRILNES